MDFALIAQSSGANGPGCVSMAFPLVLIFLIFWFLVFRPERKKQEQHEEFLDALKVGDRVMTAGGIFGEVTSVDEQTVTLRINRDNRIEVLRDQIKGPESQFLGSDDEEEDED